VAQLLPPYRVRGCTHFRALSSNADVSDEDLHGSKEELAEQRTEWAYERTLLAKERTFAAWTRTGLASNAVGFGVAELLGEMDPEWLPMTIGGALLLVGATIQVLAFLNYRNSLRKLADEDVRGTPAWLLGVISTLLSITAIAGFVLVVNQ
jgi:putative membrane protein